MLVDTHTHLCDEKFPDTEAVLAAARENGVTRMIVPTTSLTNLDQAIGELKDKEGVWLLAGVHPEEIESVVSGKWLAGQLRERIRNNKQIVGIGEIGLDFYYDKEKKTKEKQIEIFKAQLELALELDLPVVIHMREAEEECLAVLGVMEQKPRGQFHCFAGSSEFLRQVLDWGFYVSFAGNLTYKSAGNLRERLREVPLERLLTETDSPYLAPEPKRGTVNEPANVKILAEFIATELGLTLEKVGAVTTENAKCLYSLDI